MNIKHFNTLFKKVTFSSLKKYLLSKGWNIDIEFPNKTLSVFQKVFKDGCDAQLVIPSGEQYKDFYIKLEGFLNSLSVLEEKDINLLLKELIYPNIDAFEIRIISQIAQKGNLPLNYASEFINGLKDLIISSACTEENPRPYFFKPTHNAQDFAEKIKFGQTDVGSFIITIETDPFEPFDIQRMLDQSCNIIDCDIEEPFERKVLTRIQKAICQIHELKHEDNITDFVITAFEEGINSNMCEALLQMRNKKYPIEIESRFRWSSMYPKKHQLPDVVSITDNNFFYIETLCKAFKEKILTEEIEITGKVKVLKSSANIESQTNFISGFVTIEFLYDNKARTVKTYLEGLDYQKACDAHKEMKMIRVFGTLDKSSRIWHLDDTKSFSVVE